jgi:basic amino acid/polyamine antiporter, APA family
LRNSQTVSVTSNELVRGIGRWDLVALGVNLVVGAGIFGLPSRVYSLAGPASLTAYAVCSAAVILIVLCFAEVASRFTQTGGPYTYAREAFGPIVGFEVGWLRWLAGVASFAANSNLLVDYLSYLWPAVHTGFARGLVLTIIILAIATVNLVGVRDTAIVSNVLAVGKLIPLLLFIGIGVFFMNSQNFSAGSQPGYRSFSMSVLLLVYAFTGFESIGIPAGEMRDPQRNIPFSLLTTIGIATVLYVSIQIVCIGTLPGLASSTRPLTDASIQFLGSAGGYLISLGVLVSIAGNLTSQLLATPRVLFAIAEQGELPPSLVAVHARFRTPYISILLSTAVILVLALSGTFIQMVTISVMARLVMYGATCAALPVLRRRSDVAASKFTLPAGSVIAVVSVALCAWMLSNSTQREALMAVVAAGAGLVVYFAYRSTKARRVRWQ